MRAQTACTVAPIGDVVTSHLLRIVPDAGLCEATVLRQLAKAGLSVQRRQWSHAECEAGMPCLLVLTAPASDAAAANAAQQLQAVTGASVRRLRVEEF